MSDVIPSANVPYITLAQVRAEGITTAEASDAKVNASIALWSAFVDRRTRQWFNRRDITMRIEGRNSNLLMLGVPIIAVDSLRLNHFLPEEPGEVLESTRYIVYAGRSYPDDRRNPMVKIFANEGSIYGSFGRTFRRGLFTDIVGKFGFVEPDGTTPVEIQRAMLMLVVNDIKNPISSVISSGGAVGPKTSETTDLHSISFAEPVEQQLKLSGKSVSGIEEVDRILAHYRSPISIGGSILDIPRIEDGTTM